MQSLLRAPTFVLLWVGSLVMVAHLAQRLADFEIYHDRNALIDNRSLSTTFITILYQLF